MKTKIFSAAFLVGHRNLAGIRSVVLVSTLCMLGGFGNSAWAVTETWTNLAPGSNSGKWGTKVAENKNWTNDTTPQAAGDVAIFQTTGATTVSLEANVSVGTISFDSTVLYVIQPGSASTITFDSTVVDNAQLNLAATNTANHTMSTSLSLTDLLTISNQGSGTMTLSGTISGAKGIVSSGTGTVILSGANTYSGGTTVSAGKFFVNGNQTSATGAVAVNSGGLLGGTGTVGGNTTIANNATLAPGQDNQGLLSFAGNLAMSGVDSKVVMQISGTSRGAVGGYDAVNVAAAGTLTYGGDLTLNLGTVVANGTVFDLFAFSGSALGSWDSITFAGGIYTGSFSNSGGGIWTASSGGQVFTFTQSTGDLSVVPEPAAILLAGVGLLLLAARRRRRVAATG